MNEPLPTNPQPPDMNVPTPMVPPTDSSPLSSPKTCGTDDTDESEDIHVLGDVHQTPFKIDRGINESPRVKGPFTDERVNEILSKIEFGTDLTADQLAEVKDLVREFADVFALSISEVFYVDWHHHHLNVDPNVKLPHRMSQRPITENQKDWYYHMLDETESAHVIQKVPGDFLKCLNSTNLAPKEVCKTGATHTKILRKVNVECIKNGLPLFWEEVRKTGKTDKAMLDAVEGEFGPSEIK